MKNALLCSLLIAASTIAQTPARETPATPLREFDRIASRVRAYPRMHRALRLIERGDLAGARREITQALALRPDDQDARHTLLMVDYRMKDYPAAIRVADAILARSPGDGKALLYRAMANHKLGQLADALGDHERAAQGSLTVAERTFTLNSAAELSLSSGQPARAVRAIAAIPLESRDLACRQRLAFAHERSNSWPQAREAWQQALDLAPNDARILRSLADLDYRTGNLEGSLGWSRRLTAVSPTRANREFEVQLLIRLGSIDEAAALIERRINAGPPRDELLHLLLVRADLAQRKGAIDLEYSLLLRAEKLGVPQTVLQRLAGLESRKQSWRAAREWYLKSLAIARTSGDVQSLAQVEFQLGNWAAAAALYRESLRWARDAMEEARIWSAIGWSEQQRRRFPEAAAAFEEVVQRTSPPTGRAELATALELTGAPRRAAEVLRQAVLADRAPSLLLRLALLEGDLGRLNESRALATEALPGLVSSGDRLLAYRRIAYSSEGLGDYPAARSAYENAWSIEGAKPDLARSLVEICLRTGDAQAAARYARQVAAPDFDLRLLTARAETTSGDLSAAMSTLESLLTPPPPDSWRVLEAMAQVEAKRNRPGTAADLLLRAAELPGSPRSSLIERAAQHRVYLRDFTAARDAYLRLASQPDQSAEIDERLGDIEFALGRDQDASNRYRRALEHGRDTALRLAYTLARQRDFGGAIPYFERSYASTPAAEIANALAECYAQAGQAERALSFFLKGIPPEPGLPAGEQASRYARVAYLTAEAGRFPEAAAYYREAQRLQPTDMGLVRILAIEHRLGRAVSLDELSRVSHERLAPSEQSEYFDLRGAIHERDRRTADAVADFERANNIQRNAVRSFHLGGLYRQMGQRAKAVEQYRWAAKADPANRTIPGPLAYTLMEDGKRKEAIAILEPVARAAQAEPRLAAQLGYLYRGESRNREAIQQFELALPGLERDGLAVEARNVRFERSELAKQFQWNAYWTFASPGLQESSFLGTGFGAAVPSQGGVELHWRPPVVGFRNDRVLTGFVRVLWANAHRSGAIDSRSWQGGVGIRYKPFRAQNVLFSGERLFRIGDSALNYWLFRTMYSLNHGESPWRVKRTASYSTAFTDLSFFTARPQTWLYLGHFRQGISLRLGQTWLASPHVMFETRYQDRARQRVGYVQGGFGIALNAALQADDEQPPHGRIELLLQYRNGRFVERHPLLAPRETFDGIFLSVAFIR